MVIGYVDTSSDIVITVADTLAFEGSEITFTKDNP